MNGQHASHKTECRSANRRLRIWKSLTPAIALLTCGAGAAGPPPPAVLDAEASRIETIERVSPAVVCIFDEHLRGGGSGVLIDPEGHGLTNFHVVAGLLDTRKGWGGLGDGVLYELEVLGIDVTGDVAMFRLLPPSEPFRFPFVEPGDSKAVRVGQTVLALGNPFMLSEDYSPTVTVGMVTGTHRYQWGVRGNLVYSDCIQTDASINPGNSGGPLVDLRGRLIGINGRISVNTRGRFNVGFGYAITINQIRRFIPALRAGLLAYHGTWQARVSERGDGVYFVQIAPDGPAAEAGLREGDRLISLDGVAIQSANQVVSLLGTFPAHWPLMVKITRDGEPREPIVRLDRVEPAMKGPFTVNREVNLRQVRRLVDGFRRSVLGDPKPPDERKREWTVRRWNASLSHDARGTSESPPVRPAEEEEGWLAFRYEPGKPATMSRQFEDGSAGRVVTFDAARATQQATPGAAPFDATPQESLVLTALYKVWQMIFSGSDQMEFSEVQHAGADLLLPRPWRYVESPELTPGTCPGPVGGEIYAGDGDEPRLLEVVRWPLAGGAVVHFAFDAECMRLVRATVEDSVAGRSAVLHFRDYGPVGDLSWPRLIVVRSGEEVSCHAAEGSDGGIDGEPSRGQPSGVLRRAGGFGETSGQTDVRDPAGGWARAIEAVMPRVVKLYGLAAGLQAGYGTGVIVSPDGLVLTVSSLLIDARRLRAVTWDGRVYVAEVVYRDPQRHLALLRLNASGAEAEHVTEFAFFDLSLDVSLSAGDWVLAAGNAFKVAEGAEPASLAHGIFSARTRLDARRRMTEFTYRDDVLVIDAITSNPGAPGSAVVNLDGKFVGMIGRQVVSNLTHTHFNYAVPRDILYAFVEEGRTAVADGETSVALAAPSALPSAAEVAGSLGLRVSRVGYRKLLPFVEHVRSDSPAGQAGVRKGDLILSVNGRATPDTDAFEERLRSLAPDEVVDLVVRRGRQIVTVQVSREADE